MRSLHTKQYQAFIALMVLARKEADITQHELARRLKKPQSFVSKYERCERRLDVPEYIRIVRALGLDPAKLLRQIDKSIE
ncbi:helix-turn-helix transcriptional regulator [Dokdonella soli]